MSVSYSPPQAEHLVMVGPDWWSCLCWHGDATLTAAQAVGIGANHADKHAAETVTTEWPWVDVREVGTPEAVHRWLWEQSAI